MDIIIVNKESIGNTKYSFYVSRSHIYDVLKYKTFNDSYYRHVQIDDNVLASLPIQSTDISDLIFNAVENSHPIEDNSSMLDEIEENENDDNLEFNRSFVCNLPAPLREKKEMCSLLHLGEDRTTESILWPPITPVKIDLLDGSLLVTIEDLHQKLRDVPNDKLPDQLSRFGSSVHGNRSFWNQQRAELIDMVIKIGCPTLFFTLSAT